ncbi:MAG: type II toxin-antitoxin system VapC family toxin [Pseudorhodoplanes sp.]|uniref:type II toxin-antitoxin system VapC family toxin n=1 Tax=Pseudorhodoplanes sp. TaxID=1934341 RepID=UPI003D105F85
MFVDASAIVAILTEEEEGPSLAESLDAARAPITSPIAVWEAAASISRKTGRSAESELPDILAFLEAAAVVIVPIDMSVTLGALTAFDRYGRRSGHPADLNMGDCFAYAFATLRKMELLHKGKDFGVTDLRRD